MKIIPGRGVVEARNIAAKQALEVNAKYLLFLDDDVLLPHKTLVRFLELMENNDDWDVLTGIVPTKTDNAPPCIFKAGHPGPFWDWEFNTQFEIDLCGMACCMIRTSVLRRVGEPWFEWYRESQQGANAEEGEDVGFCRRVKEAGGTIVADGGVLCGHIDRDTGKVYCVDTKDRKPFRSEAAREALGQVGVGV